MSDAQDAARYRWLRQRIVVRHQEMMSGAIRPCLDVRIGFAPIGDHEVVTMNPRYWAEKADELDAAIDGVLAGTGQQQ